MSLLQDYSEDIKQLNTKYSRNDMSSIIDWYCESVAKLPQNEIADFVLEADKERWQNQKDDFGNETKIILNSGHVYTALMNNEAQYLKFEHWFNETKELETFEQKLKNFKEGQLTEKEEKTMQYKIYFNDQQLKNMKEMPVKEFDAEQKKWIQQKDANGNLLTETRCIIDLPKEAYYLTKDGHRLALDGYNLVMRNQFFRSEHDNGYYCIVESDKKYRLDKISPLKDENGEVKKTQDGKTMWDFDSKKSLYFTGKQLKVMMEAWKTREKKPLDLNSYKQKAKEYNDSKEKDETHKANQQER